MAIQLTGNVDAHRSADPEWWRLCLGLLVAPIPVALLMIGAAAGVEHPAPERLLWYVRVACGCAVGWSLVAGLAYFLVVTPWRKRIGRAECVILGGVTGAVLPYVVLSLRHFGPQGILDVLALKPHTNPFIPTLFDWTSPTNYIIPVLFLVLGLLDGWLLWRIGVRPAALPPSDVASFD